MSKHILLPIALISMVCLVACNDADEKPGTPAQSRTELKGEKHFIDGYETYTKDSLVQVLVEIPAGTLEKWEVDKRTGTMKLQQVNNGDRIVQYLAYPGNYGMIPKTLLPKDAGGDGDPLDVIVLGAAAARGSVIPVRLIGVIELLDNGEQDDKLVAVTPESPFAQVKDLAQLDTAFPGTLDILRTWFGNYKGKGIVEVKQNGDVARAKEILRGSIAGYLEGKKSQSKPVHR